MTPTEQAREVSSDLTDVQRALSSLRGAQREQMAIMRDGETTWSATHGWPALCDSLCSKGLIEITGQTMWGGRPQYRSIPTPLGLAVRAHLKETSND